MENHPKGPHAENAPFDFGQSSKHVVSAENIAMADLSLSSQNGKANDYRRVQFWHEEREMREERMSDF